MRILHLPLRAGLCLLAAAAVSLAGTSVHFELDIKKAAADSMQAKADSLEAAAEILQDKLDDIEDDREEHKDLEEEIDDLQEKISDLKDQIKDANDDLRDAGADLRDDMDDVKEYRKEALDDIEESRKEALDDINEEARERRKAGSFILAFEYSQLDTDPLKNLVKNDRSLRNARGHFDFTNNQMVMFGLMGYYSLENNVRVGNGIYAGYRPFTGSTLYDTLATGRIDSSIVSLNVIPAYIGFICEKAFVYEPVNFFAGIMLGGNMSIVVKEEQEAELASPFIGEDESEAEAGRYSVAFAPALAWDVHGGIAVRLAPNLHLGFDGVLRFAYAYDGYGTGFGDFLSVNPGMRLRLTFGKAG